MKKIFFIFLFHILVFQIFSQARSYYSTHTDCRLFINTGINYHFPLTTDYSTQEGILFMEIPLNIDIDIRHNEYVSFYTGLDISYGINYQNLTIEEEKFTFYINSLFIRIPLMAKFYFMYDKDPAFENFYLEVGGFLHFWPLNSYSITTSDGQSKTGDCYKPRHSEALPGNIFTPVNIGFKFGIGNNFFVSQKIMLGLEFFTTYLLIPSVNGYYNNVNYKRRDSVIMEFDLTVGACISIGIDLTE